eukprot:250064_1
MSSMRTQQYGGRAQPPKLDSTRGVFEYTNAAGKKETKSVAAGDFNVIKVMAGPATCPVSQVVCTIDDINDPLWKCDPKPDETMHAAAGVFSNDPYMPWDLTELWKKECDLQLWRGKTYLLNIPTKKALRFTAHKVYDNEYLFGDSGTVQMVDYQREDASYGGMQTDRGFIGFNPNMGYYDHSSASIPYVLLSACLLVLICVCCCVAITVSFIAGNATMWFAAERKENAKYEAIGNISS